ncbi:MAG TPA: hypothetical protein VFV49_13030 [Thermoanaerobaculia bacterium]|nr:hypothetical protein [Thermoanaerobaculia bacterium]
MRPLPVAVLICTLPPFVLAASAQHDISQVEPASPDAAISTPIPIKRGFRKYDIPDLAGAQQALGSQLIDGRLRKPLVDFITAEGPVEQRVSIFEGGLVVVNMTGAATIRKKLLIPEDALRSYVAAISAEELRAIEQESLVPAEPTRRSLLRIYEANGRFVQRSFNPTRILPKPLTDQITPLRDLLRAVSEDRSVTSSVAGYEPKAGDELVSDDQKIYRVTRVVDGADVVELKCLDAPTTIYVSKKDLHLYFVGRRSEE